MLFRKYLEREGLRRKGSTIDWDEWKIYAKERIPQQENGYDCGVFMLQVRLRAKIML